MIQVIRTFNPFILKLLSLSQCYEFIASSTQYSIYTSNVRAGSVISSTVHRETTASITSNTVATLQSSTGSFEDLQSSTESLEDLQSSTESLEKRITECSGNSTSDDFDLYLTTLTLILILHNINLNCANFTLITNQCLTDSRKKELYIRLLNVQRCEQPLGFVDYVRAKCVQKMQ